MVPPECPAERGALVPASSRAVLQSHAARPVAIGRTHRAAAWLSSGGSATVMQSESSDPRTSSGSWSCGEEPVCSASRARTLAWICLSGCALLALGGPVLGVLLLTEPGRALMAQLRAPLPEVLRRRVFVIVSVAAMMIPPMLAWHGCRLTRRRIHDPFARSGACVGCGYDLRFHRADSCPECGRRR